MLYPVVIQIPRHQPNIPESVLQRLILAHVNKIPSVKVWRANTGLASTVHGTKLRFGIKGQADITGILGPTGKRLEIEVKSSTGKQTADQQAWEKQIASLGGMYILARSLDQAMVPICQFLGLGFRII